MKIRFRDLGIKLYSFTHRKWFLNNGILIILGTDIYINIKRERDNDNNDRLATIIKTTTIKFSFLIFNLQSFQVNLLRIQVAEV